MSKSFPYAPTSVPSCRLITTFPADVILPHMNRRLCNVFGGVTTLYILHPCKNLKTTAAAVSPLRPLPLCRCIQKASLLYLAVEDDGLDIQVLVQQDDIRGLADVQGAHLLVDAQHTGGIHGGGPDRVVEGDAEGHGGL